MINTNIYPFTNSEKELIKKINQVYQLNNLDKEVLYQYGLYVNLLAGLNKGLDKKQITEVYQNLSIHNRDDIKITALKICQVLKRKPDYLINEIYLDLEKKIINGTLLNEESVIISYIENKYQTVFEK